ncbi:MAG: hypothetical protein K8S15_06860 [Candidatus Aegiribacteria sp.]|nr:hypothetical protein [Candidatus Aegiribacteria sp.]
MRIHNKLAIALSFVLTVVIGCGEESAPAFEDTEPNEERVSITVIDSIGVEIGDSNYVFASIDALTHGPDGNIYVMDRGACCVKVYSPRGEFVRTIAREGNGPGEITASFAMAVLGDGRISICAPMQGGIHNFLPDGEWEGLSAEFTNNPPMKMVGADSNAYIALKLTIDVVDGELISSFLIGRYEEDNEPSVLYYETDFQFDPTDLTGLLNQTLFSHEFFADRSGNVYIAPYSTEDYIVNVFDRDGNQLLHIEKEVPQVEKSPGEIQDEKAWMEAWLRNIGAQGVVIEYNPEPYRWMISDIGCDSEDRIWVRRGTELAPVFDVYDAQGNSLFVAEVEGIGDDGQFWDFIIDEYGIMAYSLNPDYYSKIWLMEISEEKVEWESM